MNALEELRKKLTSMWMRNELEEYALEGIVPYLDAIKRELAENYVALPRDADGEPVRIGDKMENRVGSRYTVDVLGLTASGWEADDFEHGAFTQLDGWHHYHAPTVESVLRELLDKWRETPTSETDQFIAEFAERLQLKDGDAS